MQVLQKKKKKKGKKKFAHFQNAFYIQLNVDTCFIVILNCFRINKRTSKFICFMKFKLLHLALVDGVFQNWITFSQCSGLYVEN